MVIQKKKRVICIGIMLVLTTFATTTANVSAQENSPPVADAGGPYTGFECNATLLNGSGSYDPDNDLLTYRWYIEGTWYDNGNNPIYDWTWFDDFSGQITLEVSDGQVNATNTTNVTIWNSPPVINSTEGPLEVAVDSEVPISVRFYDGFPDPRGFITSLDTYNATFSWDDGSVDVLSLVVGEFWANYTHIYTEIGTYHIIITIVDDNGGTATTDWYVFVNGNQQLVEGGPDGFIDEGSTFTSSGFIADADSPAFTAIVDYNDETGPQSLQLNEGNTFDLSHTYVDDGVYTVLVTIFKEDMEYGSDTTYVTVNNVPPRIESLSLSPTNPYQPGVPFELTGIFSDPGLRDTHMVTIDWGDGTSASSTIEAGVSIARGSHSYANAGEYNITLTLIDNDGGSSQASIHVVVKSPVTSIDVLKEIIAGLKIPKGLKNNLLSILENLPDLMKHPKIRAVVNQLQAFIHYVKAQNGKKLPRDQASELIHAAQLIIKSLKTR